MHSADESTEDGPRHLTRHLARRFPRRRLLAAIGAAGSGLAAAALIGCERRPTRPGPPPAAAMPATPSGGAPPSIRRGGVWRMALSADPGSLDPHANPSGSAKAAAAAVYSRLLAYEPGPGKAKVSFNTVPDAAESTQSPNARTFIVRLNPRARFTAPVNRAITAADVKYSFERAGRFEGGAAAGDAPSLMMIEAVETPHGVPGQHGAGQLPRDGIDKRCRWGSRASTSMRCTCRRRRGTPAASTTRA